MHSDPDALALVALDDPSVPESTRAHVLSCARCASDLRSLRRVVELARAAGPDVETREPSAAVWSGIRRELHLGAERDASIDGERARAADARVDAPRSDVRRTDVPRADATGADATGADVPRADVLRAGVTRADAAARRHRVPRGARRSRAARRSPASRRRTVVIVTASLVTVAAVAAIVAGIVGVRAGSASVIAETRLDALPTWTGSAGTAIVERRGDGTRELVVDLETPTSADHPVAAGHREVWLLSADARELVSVGIIEGTEGRFPLPSGVDLSAYPIVDVSEEPDDGDPAHSGDSIVRGTLPT